MIHRIIRQQDVPAPLDEVWVYFATPANLNEMTPLDMNFEIIHGGQGKIFQGQLIEYRVQFMPLIKKVGWWVVIANLANAAWIFAWHYQIFALTLLLMVTLLVSLLMIYQGLETGQYSLNC